MADVQIAIIDQQNTQIALAAPAETQVTAAVPGVQGPKGEGVPAGGTVNQVLFKQSSTNYDTAWSAITSAMIGDLQIVDGDVSTTAAIAGTKISPNFGAQNVVTTGTNTAASFIPTSSTVPTNGLYLPSANNVAIATNSTGKLFINSSGQIFAQQTAQLSNATNPTFELTGDVVVNSSTTGIGQTAGIGFYHLVSSASATRPGARIESVAEDTYTGGVGVTYDAALKFYTAIDGTLTERLRITSTGQIQSAGLGSAASPALSFTTDTNTGIYSPGADQLAISTNGTRRLIILSDGKVGLGAASVLQQGSGVDGGSAAGILELYNGGTGNTTLENTGAFPILFKTNGSERLRITSTGQLSHIGAGSSSTPAVSFSGSAPVNSLVVDSSGRCGIGSSAPGYNLELAGSNPTFGIRTSLQSASSASTILFRNKDGNGNDYDIGKVVGATVGNGGYGELQFYTAFNNTLSQQAVLTREGRLGIGVTSPVCKLQVGAGNLSADTSITKINTGDANVLALNLSNWTGSSTSYGPKINFDNSGRGTFELGCGNGINDFYLGNGSTRYWTVDSSGRFGIGTSAPSALLHIVSGGGTIRNAVDDGTTAGTATYALNSFNGAYDMAQLTATQGAAFTNPVFKIRVSDTSKSLQDRLTIDSSGRVGIGVTSPGYLFEASRNTSGDVAAFTASTDRLRPLVFSSSDNTASGAVWTRKIDSAFGVHAWSINGTERLRITSAGNVGIGSTLSGNASNRTLIRSDSASAISNVLLLNNGPSDNNAGQGVRINLSGVSEANSHLRYAYIEAANTTSGNDHYIAFGTNAAGAAPQEAVRIDSSRRLLVGTSSSRATHGSSLSSAFQVEGTTYNTSSISVIRNQGGFGAGITLAGTGGTTLGSVTAVSNNNGLGGISFQGSDGTNLIEAAGINAEVDGTPGANDMPGRLVFSTTADGQPSPTERLRITSTGQIQSAGLGSAASPALSFTTDTNTGIYSPGADQLAISTGGSGRLFVDADGEVGIGTGSPDGLLTLAGANSNVPRFRIQHPSSDRDAAISTYFDGSGTYLLTGSNHYFSSAGSNAKFDATSGSSAWYLDGTGVGIFYNSSGSGSITERFRIRADGTFEIKGGGTAGSSPAFSVNPSASANSLVIDSSGRLGIGSSIPSSLLHIGGGATGITQATLQGGSVAGDYGIFAIQNGSTVRGRLVGDASVDALRIDTGGGASTKIQFYTGSSYTHAVTIDSSQRVGIGVTNPTQKLQVTDGSLSNFYVAPGYNSGVGTLLATGGSEYLAFATNGLANERARIDSSGRLLVGTSTGQGSSLLQVQGTSSSSTVGADVFLRRGALPSVLGAGLGFIYFGDNSGNLGAVIGASADGSWTSGSNHRSFLSFSTTANNGTDPTERARIDSSGNLGVGVTSPATASFGNVIRNKAPAGSGASGYFAEGANSDTWFGIYSGTGTSDSAALVYPSAGSLRIATTTGVGVGGFSERLRIDSSGRLLVGLSSARTNFFNTASTFAPLLQIESATDAGRFQSLIGNYNGSEGPHFCIGKTRGTTVGSNTVVASGDDLGAISFLGSDGSEFVEAARIQTQVDGTPGANDMPGRLIFSTTADGAFSPTERMRITSDGNVGIGKTSTKYKLDASEARIGDGCVIYSKNITKTAGTTHTATISFESQGSAWEPKHIEVMFAGSLGSSSTAYAGIARYMFTTNTSVGTITELEDSGNGVSFAAAASGMDVTITATTTANNSYIGFTVRVVCGGSGGGFPTGMTIA